MKSVWDPSHDAPLIHRVLENRIRLKKERKKRTWLWIDMEWRRSVPVMLLAAASMARGSASPQRIRLRRSRIFAKLCRVTIQHRVLERYATSLCDCDTLQRPSLHAFKKCSLYTAGLVYGRAHIHPVNSCVMLHGDLLCSLPVSLGVFGWPLSVVFIVHFFIEASWKHSWPLRTFVIMAVMNQNEKKKIIASICIWKLIKGCKRKRSFQVLYSNNIPFLVFYMHKHWRNIPRNVTCIHEKTRCIPYALYAPSCSDWMT